jgi:hypothetical protein
MHMKNKIETIKVWIGLLIEMLSYKLFYRIWNLVNLNILLISYLCKWEITVAAFVMQWAISMGICFGKNEKNNELSDLISILLVLEMIVVFGVFLIHMFFEKVLHIAY